MIRAKFEASHAESVHRAPLAVTLLLSVKNIFVIRVGTVCQLQYWMSRNTTGQGLSLRQSNIKVYLFYNNKSSQTVIRNEGRYITSAIQHISIILFV